MRRLSNGILENTSQFFSGSIRPEERSFTFFPNFFNDQEQKILLQSCLKKLNGLGSHRARKQRRDYTASKPSPALTTDLFLPDKFYEFEEVDLFEHHYSIFVERCVQEHFDGVIKGFREMHISSWPQEDFSSLSPLLHRLEMLLPNVNTETHVLHLSSTGEIFPHVDNIEASGSWILGVSLGFPRVLKMEDCADTTRFFDVLLPSGSVYVQRQVLRP